MIGINLKALALLTAGHFVTDINTGALPALLPFLKEHLHLSYTMTASIVLTFNITSSVVQPIFGYFSDRWSARWLLPAGCLVAPLGLALLALGSAYGWVLLFTGISGFGQASYHPEAFKTVNVLGGERKATAISLFLLGGNLGLFLILSGFILCSSNAITMAMGQSFMPKATAMASALILGLSMGVGGIIVTGVGWVADHWGIIWALQATFLLPILAFLISSFIPYPPQPQTGR